ncbi:MAG TPA: hypothetical protein VFB96_16205 [Pirellulaceae bacterium]|nr:hypothetical protein [Pirellulaceae bacterium]
MAALAWRFQRARTQAAAVATIRKLGGNVTYDSDGDFDSKGMPIVRTALIPNWFRQLCGMDFFQNTVGVLSPNSPPNSDSDSIRFWQAVDELPRLKLVHADGPWVVPSAAAKALVGKTELKYLSLRSANLGDDDLHFIRSLRQLYGLDLNGSAVSDRGVRFLVGLPKLGIADLRGTAISARGIDDFERHYPTVSLGHD